MIEQLYNLVTLFLVAALNLTLFGVLLRRTYEWTWLGRGLLVFFLVFGIAFTLPFLRLTGWEIPLWTNQALRLVVIVDSIVILVSLLRYPFPPAPDGIQWTKLLGLE